MQQCILVFLFFIRHDLPVSYSLRQAWSCQFQIAFLARARTRGKLLRSSSSICWTSCCKGQYGDGDDYGNDNLTIYCSSPGPVVSDPSTCHFTNSELLCWVTFKQQQQKCSHSSDLCNYTEVLKVPWALWCQPLSLLEFEGRHLFLVGWSLIRMIWKSNYR